MYGFCISFLLVEHVNVFSQSLSLSLPYADVCNPHTACADSKGVKNADETKTAWYYAIIDANVDYAITDICTRVVEALELAKPTAVKATATATGASASPRTPASPAMTSSGPVNGATGIGNGGGGGGGVGGGGGSLRDGMPPLTSASAPASSSSRRGPASADLRDNGQHKKSRNY